MVDILQSIVLALVQGVTEFLPISSSAHLILVPRFTDWPDQGLAFDVALNTATWLAVVVYFRGDLLKMGVGVAAVLASALKGGGLKEGLKGNPDAVLALKVVTATVPVAVAGLLAHDIVAEKLRTIEVIGWSSLVWGVVLLYADRSASGNKDGSHIIDITWRVALLIGLAQAIALVPGTSRAGITITAGLLLGLSRVGAARFSFLLAVVVGFLAGANEFVNLIQAGMETPWAAVAIGFVVSLAAAYLTIHYFLRFISHASMLPFVVYRVALGVALIGVAWMH